VTVAVAVPRAQAWRTRLRRARRRHRDRTLGDTLTNLYMLLWLVVVYGGALVTTVQEHLRAPAQAAGVVAERYWIAIAVLLVGAGLAWQGIRALGPLLATPAEQAWGLSTPIDRRAWLMPRFVAVVLAGAIGGVIAAMLVIVVGLRGGGLGAAALAGGACGVIGTAAGVAAQGAPVERRWPRLSGVVLMSAGAAAAALMVGTHYLGRVPPRPTMPVGHGLAVVGVPLAIVAVGAALSALGRLDALAIGAGAPVAAAAVTAAVWLDPSLLSRVLDVRRWRRVGRVRSRRFLPLLSGRTGALLQAELRRQARRPGALVVWGALVLAQYAVAAVAPSVAGVVHVVGAYLAANRLTGGLRTVSGSAGLRRALGGDDLRVRLVHLVVPALGTALWWAITGPAAGPSLGAGAVVLVAGIVAAAYRAATRPPMSYGGTAFETPLGAFPIEILFQLARGPDLLGVVIVLQVILGR
jgi:Family of unknown function (DUF6297)